MRLPFAPSHHATTAAAAAGRSWTAALVAATLLFSPVQDMGLLPAPFAPGAAQAKELASGSGSRGRGADGRRTSSPDTSGHNARCLSQLSDGSGRALGSEAQD